MRTYNENNVPFEFGPSDEMNYFSVVIHQNINDRVKNDRRDPDKRIITRRGDSAAL